MKYNKIIKLSAAGVFSCLVLRVLQLLVLIDGPTGFGKVGTPYVGLNLAVYLLTVLVMAAIFVLTSFFSNRQPVAAPDTTISPSLSVFSFVMMVSLLFRGGIYLLFGGGLASSYGILYIILHLLSILFFAFYGISGFGSIKCPKLFSIFPVLLYGYDLIAAFIGYTGMANISNNVYECLFYCLCLFFFLLHGKVLSSVDIRRSSRILLPTTWLAAFMGFMISIPPLVAFLLGGKEILHGSPLTSVSALFPTIYMLLFTSALYKKQ